MEGASPRGAQPVLGPGLASSKGLGADDVAGVLQLACVHAEVAVARLDQLAKVGKAKRMVARM